MTTKLMLYGVKERLKVYAGAEHPHGPQNPRKID